MDSKNDYPEIGYLRIATDGEKKKYLPKQSSDEFFSGQSRWVDVGPGKGDTTFYTDFNYRRKIMPEPGFRILQKTEVPKPGDRVFLQNATDFPDDGWREWCGVENSYLSVETASKSMPVRRAFSRKIEDPTPPKTEQPADFESTVQTLRALRQYDQDQITVLQLKVSDLEENCKTSQENCAANRKELAALLAEHEELIRHRDGARNFTYRLAQTVSMSYAASYQEIAEKVAEKLAERAEQEQKFKTLQEHFFKKCERVAHLENANSRLTAEREELIKLVLEARRLIVERGESMDVPLQFSQHGWLNTVNKKFPVDGFPKWWRVSDSMIYKAASPEDLGTSYRLKEKRIYHSPSYPTAIKWAATCSYESITSDEAARLLAKHGMKE